MMQDVQPFSAFMQNALYGESGYYMKDRSRFGRSGDFFTSAQVSPLFGALWALVLFSDVSENLPIKIVELGCGDGGMSEPLLRAILFHSKRANRAVYYAGIDVSPVALARTKKRVDALRGELANPDEFICWWAATVTDLTALTGDQMQGCWVIGNEILDALPCDIVRVGRDKIEKVWVGEHDSKPATAPPGPFTGSSLTSWFVPVSSSDELYIALKSISTVLEAEGLDHIVTEWSAHTERFIAGIIRQLNPQFLYLIDYGGYSADVMGEDRPNGSLRSFRQHAVSTAVLDDIGEKDITYDVNFTFVQEILNRERYHMDSLKRQGAFLLGVQGLEAYLHAAELQTPGIVRRALPLFLPGGGLGDRFIVCRATALDSIG